MPLSHTSHTSDLTTHRDGSGHTLHTARIVVAVDLSAVIFVVLALAWAAYLIPKALKHHDDMASDRLIEGHSDKVRILSRKARAAAAEVAEAVAPAPKPAYDVAADPGYPARKSEPVPQPAAPVVSRATARKAARRRRRVLGVLVLALVVVWGLTWFAYLPIWAPGVPGALVVAWLVVARLSVRKQQRRRPMSRVAVAPVSDEAAPVAPRATPVEHASNADEFLDRLADEDTTGIAREEIEEALASDGSLWDPLPMTLPTYVNKARARRTVRTIELTGISSSGHSETDSTLAREAAESARADEEATERRKAAGA
jgi:hypothetical protein